MKAIFLIAAVGLTLLPSRSWSGIERVTAWGDTLRAEFYGNLVLGPDRNLSNALMQAKGQYLNDTSTDTVLVTAAAVVAVSADTLKIRMRDTIKAFRITQSTRLCKDGRPMILSDIKVGDVVTVTSRIKGNTALTVRHGPMLFSGMPGKLTLKHYRCDQAPRATEASTAKSGEPTLSFKAVIKSFDATKEAIVIQFAERSEVQPGVFVDPGTMGSLKIKGAVYNPSDQRAGMLMKVTQVLRDGKWIVQSVKPVPKGPTR